VNWIQRLSRTIDYIEDNLTNEISIDEVAKHAYSSNSHFQLVFHVVTGLTVGEYIRNRRLSMAAQDLLRSGDKVIDVAMRYQYDTQESFSKAFTRFHGISPSKLQKGQARLFNPFVINVIIQGGFEMTWKLNSDFHLVNWNEIDGQSELSADDKYDELVDWAGQARATNPDVFDSLTEWLLTDSEWTADKLVENEQILMQGVFERFKKQNARLREYLKKLEPEGVVNYPVFKALDDFDKLLSGEKDDFRVNEAISGIFTNFSTMQEREIRVQFAGGKTGRHGTDSVSIFGYINHLKNCDAQVQWCLFMPDEVKNQQIGFKVESFEYKHMPTMRFIGKDCGDDKDKSWLDTERLDISFQGEITRTLDTMNEHISDIKYDVLLVHHYGKGVDVEAGHFFFGRFMKADTPVPEGFVHFDFTFDYIGGAGLPFQSQFAFSTFSGDSDAINKPEASGVHAKYEVTRNIILGQGVGIPYPEKYWTAEIYTDGKPGNAYMFSAIHD